jgi:hypothetical protein
MTGFLVGLALFAACWVAGLVDVDYDAVGHGVRMNVATSVVVFAAAWTVAGHPTRAKDDGP